MDERNMFLVITIVALIVSILVLVLSIEGKSGLSYIPETSQVGVLNSPTSHPKGKTIDSVSNPASLAAEIYRHYNVYDAFIVRENPKDIVYTATYLSFVLENLNKTVILTTDSKDVSSLIDFCLESRIPEVLIHHNNSLTRACRTKKYKDEFLSPNYPFIKRDNEINTKYALKPPQESLNLLTINNVKDVVVIKGYPNINDSLLVSASKNPNVGAIIIEGRGALNISSAISEIINQKIPIVYVSEDSINLKGETEGVIYSGVMTLEAVYVKLLLILGISGLDISGISNILKTSLRGEC